MIDGLFPDLSPSLHGRQQGTMDGGWVNCWPTLAEVRAAVRNRAATRFAAERARIWGA